MDRTRRRIVVAGLLAALAAAAVPPWRCVGTGPGADTWDIAAGYGCVLRPPQIDFPQRGRVPPERLRVDAGLLLVELTVIGGGTGLALVGAAARTRSPANPEPPVGKVGGCTWGRRATHGLALVSGCNPLRTLAEKGREFAEGVNGSGTTEAAPPGSGPHPATEVQSCPRRLPAAVL
jgi:hypothetical protein